MNKWMIWGVLKFYHYFWVNTPYSTSLGCMEKILRQNGIQDDLERLILSKLWDEGCWNVNMIPGISGVFQFQSTYT